MRCIPRSILFMMILTIGLRAPDAFAQAQASRNPRQTMDDVELVIKDIETQVAKLQPDGSGVHPDELRILHVRGEAARQSLDSIRSLVQQRGMVDRWNSLSARLFAGHKRVTDTLNFFQTEILRKQGMGEIPFQTEQVDFESDVDRLTVLGEMFDPESIKTNPQVALISVRQIEAAKVERRKITERYAPMMGSPAPEAQKLRDGLARLDQQLPAFEQAIQQFRSKGSAAVDTDVIEAVRLAQTAISGKRPLDLVEGGPVDAKLDTAEARAGIVAALVKNSSQTTKVENARKRIAQMIAPAEQSLVQANLGPEDGYQKPDRAALIEAIQSKWASSGDASAILKIGIQSDDWARRTIWEWKDSAWIKIDQSRLRGFAIVKLDDSLAGIHWVDLVKDHRAADRIEASVRTEVGPPDKMLRANVK